MNRVYMQLEVNGRAIWQVDRNVPEALCRRMSEAEFEALGARLVEVLKAVVDGDVGGAASAPASKKDSKKRR